MGQGPGGGQKFAKFVTLVQFYKSSMFPCASSSRTLTLSLTLLLAIPILYFGPFRGVMKIRIAVTLVVLGLLTIGMIGQHPTIIVK